MSNGASKPPGRGGPGGGEGRGRRSKPATREDLREAQCEIEQKIIAEFHHLKHFIAEGLNVVIDEIHKIPTGGGSGEGHFSMHVTAVEFPPEQEAPVPTIDPTPDLDLASSSVRAKISVINSRLPDGSRVPPASIVWSTDNETDLPLEACPDDTVKDEAGAEVLDPADSLPLNINSTFANTPLTPEPGAKAGGVVTCSAPGMASITKRVRYGDAAVGHFTMVATEAPEA